MSLTTVFEWLGSTAPGKFLAASTAAFATVESIHLLGLAVLGGAVLVVDLALVGGVGRIRNPLGLARSLFPLFLVGLLIMAVSGVLLVAAGPIKYLLNPLFPWKFLALAVTAVIHLAVYPGTSFLPEARRLPVARLLAGVSLVGWILVAVIGRWVGLI